MKQDLRRRLAKLESLLGTDETKLRRLATRLGIEPERVLQAIRGREAQLAPHLDGDGLITWEGFLLLRKWLRLKSCIMTLLDSGRA